MSLLLIFEYFFLILGAQKHPFQYTLKRVFCQLDGLIIGGCVDCFTVGSVVALFSCSAEHNITPINYKPKG